MSGVQERYLVNLLLQVQAAIHFISVRLTSFTGSDIYHEVLN